MDFDRLRAMRDIFKREIMPCVAIVEQSLAPIVHDIDLRVDDLFVEFQSSEMPVVHDLRNALRLRIDRLYTLSTAVPLIDRPFCRTVFAYAQYAVLHGMNSAITSTAMYDLFERERVLVVPTEIRG